MEYIFCGFLLIGFRDSMESYRDSVLYFISIWMLTAEFHSNSVKLVKITNKKSKFVKQINLNKLNQIELHLDPILFLIN